MATALRALRSRDARRPLVRALRRSRRDAGGRLPGLRAAVSRRRRLRAVSRPSPAFDATLAVGPYRFPLDRLVIRLKYAGHLPLACALGHRLGEVARASGAAARVEALVPMPLAPERQRERGANQAREIACAAARTTRLPIEGALRRTRHAAPQASLGRRERARSLRGAFVATRPLAGARLALVDDVMTSGATAAAAASALRRAGAARVEVWVVARSLAD